MPSIDRRYFLRVIGNYRPLRGNRRRCLSRSRRAAASGNFERRHQFCPNPHGRIRASPARPVLIVAGFTEMKSFARRCYSLLAAERVGPADGFLGQLKQHCLHGIRSRTAC